MSFAKRVTKQLKNNGLSIEIIEGLIEKLNLNLKDKNTSDTFKVFLAFLKTYLEKYQNFINHEQWKEKKEKKEKNVTTVHACSDVIERLFGIYKAKVSDNYFVTTTTIGLELPLMCLSKEELTNNIQVALESVTISKIRKWISGQKSDNQSSMRAKFFKK